MRLAELAGLEATPALHACLEAIDPAAPRDYRELAALVTGIWQRQRPKAVGLCGGQGAGKSTLGRLLVEAWEARGLRCAALCLDDFYLTARDRRELAQRVHPLFETRGPPGTHDAAACLAAIRALAEAGEVRVPIFDKGADDRRGERILRGPYDLVLLEGWCVGARPVGEAALAEPINALESGSDPDGRWRRHIDAQLAGPYAALFEALDSLLFLRVPGLDAVRRWRFQQETQRPPAQRLDAEAVDRFVAHYERITLAMLEDLPERADIAVDLDKDHGVAALHFRGEDRGAPA